MRLSRGRSTPTRRAIRRCSFFYAEVWSQSVPYLWWGPASVPDVMSSQSAQWYWDFIIKLCTRLRSALSLLVARIGADHHDPPMPADHPALIANGLDARVHLHGSFDPVLCSYLYR